MVGMDMERWSLALEEMRQLRIVDKEYDYTLEHLKVVFFFFNLNFLIFQFFLSCSLREISRLVSTFSLIIILCKPTSLELQNPVQ